MAHLALPLDGSREGFGAFFEKRPVNSEPSWKAVDTGHVTVAPYGGYSVNLRILRGDLPARRTTSFAAVRR